ncbi:30S ribosomal protein S11, chloroplastic [Datura stramonium]|uniref:30S ribosomal protein S11, chloroplastic n=1 Tax=Datura stramonium TaxID=4076 RepID=A0ABS8VHX6_DATST|nr:30S ribosomal protein S11, chloroplastic [Datura stramonium]
MAEQTEKAFLKQPGVFLSSKKTGKGKRPGKGGNRYFKSIGLGFKTPREATEAHISSCFRVKEGDHVIIGQCRPLSKTVRFNVLKVIPGGSAGGGKKAFTGM